MSRYYEICGCIHIHFPIKWGDDGLDFLGGEANKAGLDFIVITNHTYKKDVNKLNNIFKGEGYYGKSLVLIGEEVHDSFKKNHILIIGKKGLIHGEESFSKTIEELKKQDILSFIAHPDGYHRLVLKKKDYRWSMGEIEEIKGIEVWSLLFSWAYLTNPFNLPIRYFGFPYNIKGPSKYNLSFFDKLSLRRKIVGIAGLDIHALPFPSLDIRHVFRYKNVFKILRNHIFIQQPLSGNFEIDKEVVLTGLKKGNLFFANDFLKESKGFYFGGVERNFLIGDTAYVGEKVKILLPIKAKTILIRNGKILWIDEIKEKNFILSEKGNYRVEVFIGKNPWIFSNHIYVV